jgi:hypothetical protein
MRTREITGNPVIFAAAISVIKPQWPATQVLVNNSCKLQQQAGWLR